MNEPTLTTNRESDVTVQRGAVMLPTLIVCELGSLALFIYSIAQSDYNGGHPIWRLFIVGLLGMIASKVMLRGFFTLQPNEARVLLLFGRYKGTVRESGFHWGNPFYSNGRSPFQFKFNKQGGLESSWARKEWRNKISLRVRNLNSDKLK